MATAMAGSTLFPAAAAGPGRLRLLSTVRASGGGARSGLLKHPRRGA